MAPLIVNGVLRSIGLASSAHSTSVPPPLYSPVASTERSDSDSTADDCEGDAQLHAAQRHGSSSSLASATWFRLQLPSLTRFLADFTLGFADGLTVPFALTAGLSSLGQTDTVIYAGMAEICAGSISMGVGGYLSAKGENAAALRGRGSDQEAEQGGQEKNRMDEVEKRMGSFSSSSSAVGCTELAAAYLAPLDLPPHLTELVTAYINQRPDVLQSIEVKLANGEGEDTRTCSPMLVGLSVSVGYLLGGLLPLFPYFIVDQVGDGLLWSFIVCVIALFVFGFTKNFVLDRQVLTGDEEWKRKNPGVPWKEIRRSVWEGVQMVILGSVAALAAVVCVRLFEGMNVSMNDTAA